MGSFIRPEVHVPAIVEPFEIPDVYAGGFARAEFLSDHMVRMIFFTERNGERIAIFSLVMNVDAVSRGLTALNHAICQQTMRLF